MQILIDGAYGFDNLGDEAMLHLAINLLRRRAPDIEITVSSFRPNKICDFHGIKGTSSLLPGTLFKNIRSLNFQGIRKQIADLRSIDILMFAGGSILNEKRGKRDILVIFYKVLILHLLGKKVVFWGIAYDEVRSTLSRILVKQILRISAVIITRDKPSSEMLSDQIADSEHISSGVDILFSLLDSKTKLDPTRQRTTNSQAIRVGLSLRPYPPNVGDDRKSLDRILRDQIVKYVQEVSRIADGPLTIVPIVFSSGEGPKDDASILTDIENSLEGYSFDWPPLKIEECSNSGFSDLFNGFCTTFSDLNWVVGERFHSLVLAQILEIPYIAISYDKKIDELVSDVGMEDYSIHLTSSLAERTLAKSLLSKTENLISNQKQIIHHIKNENSFLRSQSIKDRGRLITSLIQNRS